MPNEYRAIAENGSAPTNPTQTPRHNMIKPLITGLARMGEKSSENLLAALERARAPELARLVNALGMRHVGERNASVLAQHLIEAGDAS